MPEFNDIPQFTAEEQQKFWTQVAKSDGCWLWMGSYRAGGYGRFRFRRVELAAHRVAYALQNGSVRTDRDLDHLCRNRGCVNPAHLEETTRRVNLRRGKGCNESTGRCGNGLHDVTTPESVRMVNGYPRCVACTKARAARFHARRRAMLA